MAVQREPLPFNDPSSQDTTVTIGTTGANLPSHSDAYGVRMAGTRIPEEHTRIILASDARRPSSSA
jgi:hypothetical protein